MSNKLTLLDYETCFNVLAEGNMLMGNRDKFALAAMQGILANGAIHPNNTPDHVAKLAYAMADAMIAEKDREVEETRKESEETYNAQQEAWREANKKQSP